MTELADVPGVVQPTLATLAAEHYVLDAFNPTVSPEDAYQEGTLALDAFEFVPYAVTGLAAAMVTPTGGAVRATATVRVPVHDDKGNSAQATRTVVLYGPGDVLGIDPSQVIRRYPPPGTANAEETVHAHIEFDRPELPWAFSAQSPAAQMRPWLALVVLDATQARVEPGREGRADVLVTRASELPPAGELWAWAHAQVHAAGTARSVPVGIRLSSAYAPANLSRLLAARILTQHTRYVACVVPTTDVGARTGLGLTGGTLDAAWGGGAPDAEVRLPVYDWWTFGTGADGDFPRLARRLQAVAAPWAVGRRILDTTRPAGGLAPGAADTPGARQVVECALFSPNSRGPQDPAPQQWSDERTDELRTVLERAAELSGTDDPDDVPDLPILGPRLYAGAHAGAVRVGDVSTWFGQLNLRPTARVTAGLGTRVLVKDQEQLMQAAWAQVGEVDAANRALRGAQFARYVAEGLHRRLARLDIGELLQVTAPVHPRMTLPGNRLTLKEQAAHSATAPAALRGSFRRVVRATGPLCGRLPVGERAQLVSLVSAGTTTRDFTRTYVEPDGVGRLSPEALSAVQAASVQVTLGGELTSAPERLRDVAATAASQPEIATTLTRPDTWGQPLVLNPLQHVVDRAGSVLEAMTPSRARSEVVLDRAVGGLLSGLATSGVAGTERYARSATTLVEATARVVDRAGAPAARLAGLGGTGIRATGIGTTRIGTTRIGTTRIGATSHGGVAAAAARGLIIRPGMGAAVRGGEPTPMSVDLAEFVTSEGRQLATRLSLARNVTADAVRAGLADVVLGTSVLRIAPTPVRPALAVSTDAVLARLAPSRTVVDAVAGRLGRPEWMPHDWFADTHIRPVMAAPRFDRPMFEALDSYDREWLVPGLGLLPPQDLITLLECNDEFTEAFLVGLSDEMGRELLWRGYPTDRRGTYFRRFWSRDKDELRELIHAFAGGVLGSHTGIGTTATSGRAAVVVRGEVVRRYPDLLVHAMRQTNGTQKPPALPESEGAAGVADALFMAFLPPDYVVVGLDITIDELREPGWWLVVSEHPGATRFDRDEPDLPDGATLGFAHPTNGPHAAAAGLSGASEAGARLRHPVRVAFATDDVLRSVPVLQPVPVLPPGPNP